MMQYELENFAEVFLMLKHILFAFNLFSFSLFLEIPI